MKQEHSATSEATPLQPVTPVEAATSPPFYQLPENNQQQQLATLLSQIVDLQLKFDLRWMAAQKMLATLIESKRGRNIEEDRLYVHQLIEMVMTCQEYGLRKKCHSIITHLIKSKIDWITEQNSIFRELLEVKHIRKGLFYAYLSLMPIIQRCKGYSPQISAPNQKLLIQLANSKLLPSILKIHEQNDSSENLYLFTKTCYKLFQSTIQLSQLSIIFPILFKAGFATNPSFDTLQVESCPLKNTPMFYYSHAKKWAAKAIKTIIQRIGRYLWRWRERDLDMKSACYSCNQLWFIPYAHQFVFDLLVKTPSNILFFKLESLLSFMQYKFIHFSQYMEILMINILPALTYYDERQFSSQNKSEQIIQDIKKDYPMRGSLTKYWERLLKEVTNNSFLDQIIGKIEELLTSSDIQNVLMGFDLFDILLRQWKEANGIQQITRIIEGAFIQLLRSKQHLVKIRGLLTIYDIFQKKRRMSTLFRSTQFQELIYTQVMANKATKVSVLVLLYLIQLTDFTIQIDYEALLNLLFQFAQQNQYLELFEITQAAEKMANTQKQKSFYLLKLLHLFNTNKEQKVKVNIILSIFEKKTEIYEEEDLLLVELFSKYLLINSQVDEKQKSLISFGLKRLQNAYLQKKMGIAPYFVGYFNKMVSEWRWNQRDHHFYYSLNYDNFDYVFLITYMENGVKQFKTVDSCTSNVLEPIFSMIETFTEDNKKRQMVMVSGWAWSIHLLHNMIVYYEHHPAWQSYSPRLERILNIFISSKKQIRKKKEQIFYLKRLFIQLVIAYLHYLHPHQDVVLQDQKGRQIDHYFIKNFNLFEIQRVIGILNIYMALGIYSIVFNSGITIGIVKLLLRLLLQISSILQQQIKTTKLQDINGAEKRERMYSTQMKLEIQDKGVNLTDSHQVFFRLREQINKFKQSEGRKLRVILMKFKKKEVQIIEKILKLALK